MPSVAWSATSRLAFDRAVFVALTRQTITNLKTHLVSKIESRKAGQMTGCRQVRLIDGLDPISNLRTLCFRLSDKIHTSKGIIATLCVNRLKWSVPLIFYLLWSTATTNVTWKLYSEFIYLWVNMNILNNMLMCSPGWVFFSIFQWGFPV